MEAKKAHVSEKKKSVVKKIEELLKKYPNIGVIDMTGLPCAQLQKLRKKLGDKMEILAAKKRLIKIAIENAKKNKKNLEKLEEHLKGTPALMGTSESPFKIYKIIQKSKSKAAAKAGDIAPIDLIIPAGPTQFGPGPIIGELGQAGIKASIEGGKVTIKADFTAAKQGAVITNKIVGLLAKFGIQPMEIGLNVVAIYENGDIFTSDVLSVDEQAYIDNITKAASWAFNLAVEAGYFTKETVEVMLPKAFREAKALAIEQGILEKEVVEEILSKVNAQASSLKNELNI
ncbi:50S ribosomal protein L10 [Candidatus Woesearchaeota archaeon]|nr:50S ribosomal protein L10 [Candidatus Woesearchaeota archaeon]